MGVIRVVVAGPGADGHDRSPADAAARSLRDAGMEVVRILQTGADEAGAVARSCVQEDAAAVCVPGAARVAETRAALAAEGAADVPVLDVEAEPDVAAVIRAHTP